MKKAIWVIIGLFIFAFSTFMYLRKKPVYVSITFDDGYVSQYEASKILERQGIKATFFVTCLSEFENRSLMNSKQIGEIARYHEIGWHTCHHVNMSQANESEIMPKYGAKVFAYPYGYIANENLLHDYIAIRTIEWGYNSKRNCSHLQAITLTKNNFEYALSYAEKAKPGDWIIFVIHDVGGNRSDVDISWEQFYKLLDFIKRKGWKVVTLEENCMD